MTKMESVSVLVKRQQINDLFDRIYALGYSEGRTNGEGQWMPDIEDEHDAIVQARREDLHRLVPH